MDEVETIAAITRLLMKGRGETSPNVQIILHACGDVADLFHWDSDADRYFAINSAASILVKALT